MVKEWHGGLNLSFLTDISPTYRKLFQQGKIPQLRVRDLRKGANEVHAAFLDLFLAVPAFVHHMCRVKATSTTRRTLLHVVAAASDSTSMTKLLAIAREQHECPVLTAALTARDAFGFTAADLAARARDLASLELLVQAIDSGDQEQKALRIAHIWSKFAPTRRTRPRKNNSRRCDIDQMDIGQLNASVFYRRYFLPRRPLLIKGGCKTWTAMSRWSSMKYLDRALKDATVMAAPIPYAKQFGMQDTPFASVRSLLRAPTTNHGHGHGQVQVPYVFDSQILSQSPKLLRDFPALPSFATPPAWLNKEALGLQLDVPQLYVGRAGSGSPMHFHSDAWNACFKGEKLYALLPPEAAVYSVTPLREWLKEVVDAETKQQILWCTQHSGDVLFVPGMYAHGVVNQKKVLGVATEMLSRHGEDLMGA
jgi:hypothetical protein